MRVAQQITWRGDLPDMGLCRPVLEIGAAEFPSVTHAATAAGPPPLPLSSHPARSGAAAAGVKPRLS